MSQNPTPYAAPPPPARRQRPRALWFFVAGGLVVLAPVVFLAALFTVLSPLLHEDAVFDAGEVVSVDLPAGVERALFIDPAGQVDCVVTDDGSEVGLRPVTGDFTLNEWTAVARFDTGSGVLSFDCRSELPGAQVRIGELPSTGGFVAGIVIGIVVPLLLGATGVIMLIVVAVLYATGEPRRKAA